MIYRELIYIHIPKTGGSSIRSSLSNNYQLIYNASKDNLKKMGYLNLKQNFENYNFSIDKFLDHLPFQLIKEKNYNKGMYIFTFVRNPFSRLVSLYYEIISSPIHREFNNGNKISFENFVKTITEKPYWFTIPMIDYIGDKNLKDLNYVGKFENFENNLLKLKRKFKIKIKHHNYNNQIKSNLKFSDYRPFYSNSKIIDLVLKYYENDFYKFNYNYEKFINFEKKKTNLIYILSRIVKRKLINLI